MDDSEASCGMRLLSHIGEKYCPNCGGKVEVE